VSSGYGDGGPAINAKFKSLYDFKLDKYGNIYILDVLDYRVRMIDTNGIINTIVGDGVSGYNGDNIPAKESRLKGPRAIAIDSLGNVFILDEDISGNSMVIRKIDTSGIITTVAGNNNGNSDDGFPANETQITGGSSTLTFDTNNNLIFGDGSRIRKIGPSGLVSTIAGCIDCEYETPSIDGCFSTERPAGYYTFIDPSGIIFNAGEGVVKFVPVSIDKQSNQSEYSVSDQDGFNHIITLTGLHKKTIDLNTGKTIYSFDYTNDNKILSITDRFNRQIVIERNSNGTPTAIIAPNGARTDLSIDEETGRLNRVMYPDGGRYEFGYTNGGLMEYVIDPQQNRSDFMYSNLGKLTDVFDQENGHWNYSRTSSVNGDTDITVTSGEGNRTNTVDSTDSTGLFMSLISELTGEYNNITVSTDGLAMNLTSSCGVDMEYLYGIDTAYRTEFVKQLKSTTPSGISHVSATERNYTDTNGDEIPDIITQIFKDNNKATTIVQNIPESIKTVTTPQNRIIQSVYNPETLQTTRVSVEGLNDVEYDYFPVGHLHYGRLHYIRSGSRESEFTYYDNGNLQMVKDPEGNVTTYGSYDQLGRVKQVTRPDGSTIGFNYDKNGNMTVLVNPLGKTHLFGFNKVDLGNSYATPMGRTYSYTFDKDRRLISTHFPSGKEITYTYDDGTGNKSLLRHIETPEDIIDYSYACSSMVGSVTMSSESVSWTYDGPLVTSETVNGDILHQVVSYTYNSDGDFDVDGMTYAGASEAYLYDNDGLLTGAGPYTITRKPENSLPGQVSGGNLILSRNFNGYGENDGEYYGINGTVIGSWSVVNRDNAGRILEKTETLNGVTDTYEYSYSDAGRLETVFRNGSLVEEYHHDHLISGAGDYRMNTYRGISSDTLSYDDEDRLLTTKDASYAYDDDGFLAVKYQGVSQTLFSYSSRGDRKSVV
jgi:YD repeat-containing protein